MHIFYVIALMGFSTASFAENTKSATAKETEVAAQRHQWSAAVAISSQERPTSRVAIGYQPGVSSMTVGGEIGRKSFKNELGTKTRAIANEYGIFARHDGLLTKDFGIYSKTTLLTMALKADDRKSQNFIEAEIGFAAQSPSLTLDIGVGVRFTTADHGLKLDGKQVTEDYLVYPNMRIGWKFN